MSSNRIPCQTIQEWVHAQDYKHDPIFKQISGEETGSEDLFRTLLRQVAELYADRKSQRFHVPLRARQEKQRRRDDEVNPPSYHSDSV